MLFLMAYLQRHRCPKLRNSRLQLLTLWWCLCCRTSPDQLTQAHVLRYYGNFHVLCEKERQTEHRHSFLFVLTSHGMMNRAD